MPQPALISLGTGIMRPGISLVLLAASMARASELVSKATTACGTFSRLPLGTVHTAGAVLASVEVRAAGELFASAEVFASVELLAFAEVSTAAELYASAELVESAELRASRDIIEGPQQSGQSPGEPYQFLQAY